MRYLTRTIIVLAVLNLATASLTPAQTSSEEQKRTFTISGNVGMGGVTMKGLPGDPITGKNGSYSATVEYGWSGTVTPTKEGYLFEPTSNVYHNVNSYRTREDYTAEIITFPISGQVSIPSVAFQGPPRNPFPSGVVMQGLPRNPVLSGVVMQGLPRNPVTDENGYYTSTVDYGWAGTVKPVKKGYTFNPPKLSYTKVMRDQKNQSYTAEQLTFTISDVIEVGGTPIPGVRVLASDGQSSVTDSRGWFNITVPYGWSGELTLEKEGYKFDPASVAYTNVTRNMMAKAEDMMYEDMYGGWQSPGVTSSKRRRGSTGYRPVIAPMAGRKVLVVPAAEVKAEDLAEIMEDMQVMSHILDERFKETRRVQGAFTDFGDFFGRDNRATEATYLQGYGVLFSMEVNFAFSPPPKPQGQETKQTAERVDSTWQRARQQMFSPGDSRRSRGSGSAEEYDSRMVEELKRDLITTLKHAANIRGVQPDEWIILTVIGGGRQSGGVFSGRGFMMGGMGMSGGSAYGGTSSGGMGGSSGGGMMGGGMSGGMAGGMMGGGMGGGMMGGISGPGEMGVSPATVLTIRAKKSDVDAFAKGEQDFEQFRQKVQIFTY